MKRIISLLLIITLIFCIETSIPLNVSATITDKGYTIDETFYGTYTNDFGEEIYLGENRFGIVGILSGFTYNDNFELFNVYFDENANVVYIDQYNNHWICEYLGSPQNGYRIIFLGYGSDGSMGLPKGIEIPAYIPPYYPVLEIGDYVFKDLGGLTGVTIPNTVTSIGCGAFENCDMLTSITIPDSVTSIALDFNHVFYDCDNLANINVSSNNKNYSSIDGVLFNKTQTELLSYPNGKSSDSYTIPNSVTSIGGGTFENCDMLTSVIIPDSVTYIEEWAFYTCFNLRDVYYTGSEKQWNSITSQIYPWNPPLQYATIHFNYGKTVAGDISGDGEIAVDDVIYVLKYVVGNVELTDKQIANADLSDDGKLTVLDAIMVQRLVLSIV